MRDPFVYEGRLGAFDPEPGYELYLIDHPSAEKYESASNIAGLIEEWAGTEFFLGKNTRRFRITVEELPNED